MSNVANAAALARFTTELLRIRVAATGGTDIVAYQVSSETLKEAQFQQWCSSRVKTIRAQPELLSEGVFVLAEELSSVESGRPSLRIAV